MCFEWKDWALVSISFQSTVLMARGVYGGDGAETRSQTGTPARTGLRAPVLLSVSKSEWRLLKARERTEGAPDAADSQPTAPSRGARERGEKSL